jgi:hypothetical protein
MSAAAAADAAVSQTLSVRVRIHNGGLVEPVPRGRGRAEVVEAKTPTKRGKSVDAGLTHLSNKRGVKVTDVRIRTAVRRARANWRPHVRVAGRHSAPRHAPAVARSDESDVEEKERQVLAKKAIDTFSDVQFVKTSLGFFVQKEMLDFAEFSSLARFTHELLDAGYTIFGSFTHYLAWCAKEQKQPWLDNTAAAFLATGRHVPRDVDVLDPEDRIRGHQFDTVRFDREVRTLEHYNILRQLGVEHLKLEYRASSSMFGDVLVSADVVRADSLLRTGLDFDVNTLSYNNGSGFVPMDVVAFDGRDAMLLARPLLVAATIDKIVRRQAEFIGDIAAGPHKRTGRTMFISRFKKMNMSGYAIKGWNSRYPMTIVERMDVDMDRMCGVCREEFPDGTAVHISRCCSAASKKLLCHECFWGTMKACAEKGRYYKCPFCNAESLIFPRKDEPVE